MTGAAINVRQKPPKAIDGMEVRSARDEELDRIADQQNVSTLIGISTRRRLREVCRLGGHSSSSGSDYGITSSP